MIILCRTRFIYIHGNANGTWWNPSLNSTRCYRCHWTNDGLHLQQSSEAPTDWKQTLVTTMYRKGQKSDSANQRPDSLTCLSCKVMEHVMLTYMLCHLGAHNILTTQDGFWGKYSRESHLMETIYHWGKTSNNKSFPLGTLSKIAMKLQAYGITYKNLNWIKVFLGRRS